MKQADKKALERYLDKLRLIREGAAANPFETSAEKAAIKERIKGDINFMVMFLFPHYATSECADFQIKLAGRVKKNKTCRILVRWPRGHAKSVWCNIIIPMWLWINGEEMFEIIAGNTYDKAKELLSDIQAEFVANARLIHYFGDQHLAGSWADGNFSTKDGRFHGMAIGMRQSVRGLRKRALRPNYISCDDLEDQQTCKNPKRQDDIVQWIENDLLKTMDGDTRRYVHPNNDPYVRSIQNILEKRHPKWHLDKVIAYDENYIPAWPEKYSPDYFREQEADGILAARAEFCHEPLIEGKIFTPDLIQWGKAPRIDHFTTIVAHWDVAYSGNNDYNAVQVWGLHGMNFWHLKAYVRRCKMEAVINWMYDYEDSLPSGTIVVWRVEAQFWNDPVRQAIETVRSSRGRWLNISIVDRSKTNKYDRILSMHPYYQNGRIYYDIREQASNDMLTSLQQLYGIEPKYSTHDDAPDADQQAIEYLAQFVSYNRGGDTGIEFGDVRRNNRM